MPTHEKHQQHNHDDHGLQQVDHEDIHGLRDHVTLVVNAIEFHPHGTVGFQLGKTLLHRFTHGDHVAAVSNGDTKANGLFAVVEHQVFGRILVATMHLGHIAQAHQAFCAAYEQVLYLLDICKFPGGFEAHILPVNLDLACGAHHVLCLDRLIYLHRRNAQGGHPCTLHLHIHHFLPHAPQVDARHIPAQQELGFQDVRVVLEFGVGVALAAQGKKHAVHVTEVVLDDGGPGPRRQQPLCVVDLAPQFVPDLRQFLGCKGILDVHIDVGHPVPGRGPDLLDLSHGLDGFLDDIRHLLLDLEGRCAGIGGHQQGGLDGEGGIFELAKLQIGS